MSTPIMCPICVGRGVVAYPPNTPYGQGWSSSSCGPWPCPQCNGSRVLWIPSEQTKEDSK